MAQLESAIRCPGYCGPFLTTNDSAPTGLGAIGCSNSPLLVPLMNCTNVPPLAHRWGFLQTRLSAPFVVCGPGLGCRWRYSGKTVGEA